MDIVEGIRKLGFRRWYERRLIEAHAYLVTGFLALILAVAFLELRGETPTGGERMAYLLGAVASLAGGIVAWLRYHRMLALVEWAGEQATCPACGEYGRIRLLAASPHAPAGDPDSELAGEIPLLRVSCRACNNEWEIDATR
jgi:hypothetical protein